MVGGAVAGLLVCAVVGILLLSRYDMRMVAAALEVDDSVTAVPSPRLSLAGIYLSGGLRVRYRVAIFRPNVMVHMDWYLWPFREIRDSAP